MVGQWILNHMYSVGSCKATETIPQFSQLRGNIWLWSAWIQSATMDFNGDESIVMPVIRLLLLHNPRLQSQLRHSTKSCQTAESCQTGQAPCVNIRKHLFVLYTIKGHCFQKLKHA